MGSLLSKIADDERDFFSWCKVNNLKITNHDNFYDDPLYKDYEDYLDPPEQREKRRIEHEKHKKKFKSKVGVLDLDSWYGATKSETEECPKCKHLMIYKYGFLVSDLFGCPKCGHTEGGEW